VMVETDTPARHKEQQQRRKPERSNQVDTWHFQHFSSRRAAQA